MNAVRTSALTKLEKEFPDLTPREIKLAYSAYALGAKEQEAYAEHSLAAVREELAEANETIDYREGAIALRTHQVDELRAELAAAQERERKLREALDDYGWHRPSCGFDLRGMKQGVCDCGFESVLRETQNKK